MALSKEALAKIFPANKPEFTPPFYREVDKSGEVHIYDSEDRLFTTFCKVTQMPIGDEAALEAEVVYWVREAGRIVDALNLAYPKPA